MLGILEPKSIPPSSFSSTLHQSLPATFSSYIFPVFAFALCCRPTFPSGEKRGQKREVQGEKRSRGYTQVTSHRSQATSNEPSVNTSQVSESLKQAACPTPARLFETASPHLTANGPAVAASRNLTLTSSSLDAEFHIRAKKNSKGTPAHSELTSADRRHHHQQRPADQPQHTTDLRPSKFLD